MPKIRKMAKITANPDPESRSTAELFYKPSPSGHFHHSNPTSYRLYSLPSQYNQPGGQCLYEPQGNISYQVTIARNNINILCQSWPQKCESGCWQSHAPLEGSGKGPMPLPTPVGSDAP